MGGRRGSNGWTHWWSPWVLFGFLAAFAGVIIWGHIYWNRLTPEQKAEIYSEKASFNTGCDCKCKAE